MGDKMNKEQSADDPSVGLIRVKNMLNNTISIGYHSIVIACIEHKVSLEAFRAIEAALVKHDNMREVIPWWLTDHHNCHSNYLVCDRANTQSVTVRKVVKLQLNYCNALVIKIEFTISSCSEGRTRDVHSSSLLIDVYALFSDVSLRRQASMTQAEKFPDPFCSRAMLICSIIWLGKRMLRVVVLRVLFFVDMRLPRIQCR